MQSRWLWCLLAAAIPLSSFAAPALERRAWIFEQLGQGFVATPYGARRLSADFRVANFSDAFGAQAVATVPVGPIEFKGRYVERFFLDRTAESRSFSDQWRQERRTVGLELASYFVSRRNEYGRLGVELLREFPFQRNLLQLSLHTGLLETVERPWTLELGFTYGFHSRSRDGSYLVTSFEVRRAVADASSLGGIATVTYRSRPLTAVGRHELVLFSVGPSLQWGSWTIRAPVRVFLDKRVASTPGNSTNPSGWTAPDVCLEWVLR